MTALDPDWTRRLFDAVRKVKGNPLTQADVDLINAALLDEIVVTAQAGRAVGGKGLALIKAYEGCARLRLDGKIEAYPDPGTGGAPWTIGWGATGPGIAKGTVWTQKQCDDRLANDLVRFANEVSAAIGNARTTQNQFDALVSFHYNTGAIARATLTKLHKAGDYAGAKAEFAKWVNAAGKRMPGLVRRRSAEAELYAS